MEEIPDYGYHREIEAFKKECEAGAFNDYDGHGCFATATEMSDFPFAPSELSDPIDEKWTHVVWFNK